MTVTDGVSGAKATYTLHARTIDHAPYTIDTRSSPEAGELYLTPFDPQGFGAAFAYIVSGEGSLKYDYCNPPRREIFDFKKTVIAGGATRYSFYDEASQGIRVMEASFTTLAVVQALHVPRWQYLRRGLA